MRTYLFYDIETTGLNKAFDQVLQFAAIRTDENFKEIDRYKLSVRLRPDIVISPRAIITHRIPVSEALKGVSEYDATVRIHKWMNAPRTTSLGYNTLGFDDEFLRFSFHRNLLPPYTHQYANGCRRMDLLPCAVMFRLYGEDALHWPEIDGKPTLKLEHLSKVNGLAPGRAHDAMVDVEATTALARKFSQKTKMWEFLTGYFDKKTDENRISDLPATPRIDDESHRKGLLVSNDAGAENAYQTPVLFIGNSIPYSNQTLWLRLDLPELRQTTPESVSDTSWVIRKRIGEPPFILPPRPRYWQRLSEERRDLAEENLAWLTSHPDHFKTIVEFHRRFSYPEIPDLDADAALYQMGFPSQREEKLCQEFHAAPLHEKAKGIDKFPRIETRTLARRILMRNYPHAAGEAEKREWIHYLNRINPRQEENALVDYRGEKRTTPVDAMSEIDSIKQQGAVDDEQLRLLLELEEYLRNAFSSD